MPAGYAERREREEQQRRREEEEARELEDYYRTHPSDGGSGATSGSPDNDLTGVPIWDELRGAYAKANREENERTRQRMEGMLGNLFSSNPSVDDLTPDLFMEATGDEYGDLLGGDSAFANDIMSGNDQRAAMAALKSLYESGGYTDADRAQSQAMRAQQAQNMGASNQAALQQMQARGIAGGGAELAARFGASEAAAGMNAQNDAFIQQAAMQRALGSLQSYGNMANSYRTAEDYRRQQLDAWNKQQLDWRRGRETTNTDYANEMERERARAHQTRYQNQSDATSQGLNMYGGHQTQSREDYNMLGQAGRNQAAALAEGIDTFGSGFGRR